jgi:zinc protease
MRRLLTRALGAALTWRLLRRARRVTAAWAAGSDVRASGALSAPVTVGSTILLPPDYGSQLMARLRQVTPAQVQAVAQKYFGDDSLTVATLLPQPLSGGAKPRRASPGARH